VAGSGVVLAGDVCDCGERPEWLQPTSASDAAMKTIRPTLRIGLGSARLGLKTL
jgi:hypothetical protein